MHRALYAPLVNIYCCLSKRKLTMAFVGTTDWATNSYLIRLVMKMQIMLRYSYIVMRNFDATNHIRFVHLISINLLFLSFRRFSLSRLNRRLFRMQLILIEIVFRVESELLLLFLNWWVYGWLNYYPGLLFIAFFLSFLMWVFIFPYLFDFWFNWPHIFVNVDFVAVVSPTSITIIISFLCMWISIFSNFDCLSTNKRHVNHLILIYPKKRVFFKIPVIHFRVFVFSLFPFRP